MNPSSAPCRWTASVLGLAMAGAGHAQAPPTSATIFAMQDLPGLGHATPTEGRSPASSRLFLEVEVNGRRVPRLVEFEQRDGRLSARASDLRDIGFRLPGHDDAAQLPLDSLEGVEATFLPATQQLLLQAPLADLVLPTTRLGSAGAPAPAAQSSPGLLLNYDVHAGDGDAGSQLSLASELRLFGLGRGTVSSTAISRRYRQDGEAWRNESVRLDTQWTIPFPEPALSIALGDAFTGFLEWSRPVRIGGIQFGRNYALQPYRITTPLPEFLGEAATPSAVELYVNGVRQLGGQVPAGPFQLTAVPGLSGSGQAQLVVSDAFGRVRTLQLPFYSTQRLLARGLSDWSVSLGRVREDFGLRSFAYADDLVGSATLRYGVNDQLTLEGQTEIADDLLHAGAGGAALLGMAGVVQFAHARSRLHHTRGSSSSLGYDWSSPRFNVSLQSTRTRGAYRDIASIYGALPPRRSDRALAGIAGPRLGNLSVSYVRLDDAAPDARRARYGGLYWNRSFAGWSTQLSYNHNLDQGDDRSLYFGLTLALGPRRQAGVSWQRDGSRDRFTADLVEPVPGDGGFGWRLQARTGQGAGGLAEAGWIGSHVRLGAGAMRWDDMRHAYAQASGSLAWMGGHPFAARSINDAFAVVSTDGLAGVPVKLENRLVGHSDARGLLLVTPLNAWQRNKLSIDPMDLPAAVRVTEVDRIATPADRAGVHVAFQLTPVHAAVLVLHDAAGQPLPVGSHARLDDGGLAIVGHDGETYLETSGRPQRIEVELPEGRCEARLAHWPDAPGIARIGPLTCVAVSP